MINSTVFFDDEYVALACRFKNSFLRQNGSPFVICTSTLMPFNVIFDKTPFLCLFVPSETPPKLFCFWYCGDTVFCILYTHNIQVYKYEYLNFHHLLPVRSTVVCFETTASFLSPCFSRKFTTFSSQCLCPPTV